MIAQMLGCRFYAFDDSRSSRILGFESGFRVNGAIKGTISFIVVPWLPPPWIVQSQKQLVVSRDAVFVPVFDTVLWTPPLLSLPACFSIMQKDDDGFVTSVNREPRSSFRASALSA